MEKNLWMSLDVYNIIQGFTSIWNYSSSEMFFHYINLFDLLNEVIYLKKTFF